MPLPTWLVNKLSVTIGYKTFVNLRKQTEDAARPPSMFAQSMADPENEPFYGRLRALEGRREQLPLGCKEEVMATGWVKDVATRRRLFSRERGSVLVPME